MHSRRLRKIKDRLLMAIIALAGLAAGGLGYQQARDGILDGVLEDARHSAVAFQSADLAGLTGTPGDVGGAPYASLRSRLRRFRETDGRVASVWIFRYLPALNKAVMLADSAPEDVAAPVRPGDAFTLPDLRPDLQTRLRTGEAALDGPGRTDQGTVLTGFALIGSKPLAAVPRDFLAVNFILPHWRRDLAMATVVPMVFVWVLLGLPLAGFFIVRRETEQGEAIRNLSEAVEQSRAAVMIIDLNGDIEYANRGLCEQIGCKRRDLIGHGWRNFQVADATSQDLTDLVMAVKTGRAWSGEWYNRRKDGKIYPVRGAFTPVKRRNGKLACFIATFDDMTEIKRTEAVLRESKDRAEAGETAKSQFLATMSHEVRTPLNGIIGFTSLLLDTPLTPEQREFVQTIQLSSEALIQLTGDILDFARIESGKLQLDPLPCSPRECVEDALDLVATKAGAKGIELLHWVDDSVPAVIFADGNRLRQVLINLVKNAVTFTTQGEVEVRVRAERGPVVDARSHTRLIFSVRDTGIGIPADQHAKLFKPFTQLDHALTRRHGGTGLGLAICKNIVELMGGQIFLKSEPGQGSIFSFTIGVEPNPVVADRKPLAPLESLRLAVAAPEGPLRAELARLGKRFGTRLVETTPGLLAATPDWDVALMDLDQARIAELAAETQPSPELPPERVFGLVPLAMPSAARAALRTHFRLLLNKPLHHDALYSALAAVAEAPVVAQPKRSSTDLSVLLVEDDPVNRLLMQKQLTALGCRWTKAENGRVALQELARKPFDLVLMDLYMPEVDGVTAIKQIRAGRAGDASKNIWIAALTADARNDQKERTIEMGANDYLVKPVSMPELRVALEKFAIARRARG